MRTAPCLECPEDDEIEEIERGQRKGQGLEVLQGKIGAMPGDGAPLLLPPPPRSDGLGDAAICRWDKMAMLVCACQGVEGSRGASLGGWEGGSEPAAVFRRQILAAS